MSRTSDLALGATRKERNMDSPTHDLKGLFDQLGLDSSEKAIDDFIESHSPLPEDKKLIDAEFWTPQQAAFLKEQLREDADWARVVDDLNLRMHQIH
jgi:hypothetical protein